MRTNSKSVIRTAVFPVAGRGTRFLPATKASPKEMLPVVDKPLIQYAVEEALAAGATRLVFVTGASKRAIEDHFDSDQELEHLLEAQGKSDLLNQLRSVLPSYASCICTSASAGAVGPGARGVVCAAGGGRRAVFHVHLADDLIRSGERRLPAADGGGLRGEARQCAGRATGTATSRTPRSTASWRWRLTSHLPAGCAVLSSSRSPPVAPSDLAVVGRYVVGTNGAVSSIWKKIRPTAGRWLRFSSPMALRRLWVRRRCMRIASLASAMTAAASWATCRRRWSTRWRTPSWARNSASISNISTSTRLLLRTSPK